MDFATRLYNAIFCDFKGLNLTSIKDKDEFDLLQILDSIRPLDISQQFSSDLEKFKLVLDVGFGGGFPLLPLANIKKDITFLGVDARKKKVDAVRAIIQMLDLSNVQVFHERIENLFIDQELVIVVKAVGDIADILGKIKTSKRIRVYFYKGPNVSIKESVFPILKKWRCVETVDYLIGSVRRTLVVFENINVPHGTFKDHMKKLSECSTWNI